MMVLQEGAVTDGDVIYGWMVVVNDEKCLQWCRKKKSCCVILSIQRCHELKQDQLQ